MNKDNFFLLGHSWGGILAIEYALQHQQHLKGLIISNMMASVPEYNRYADQVLKTTIDPAVLAELQAIEAAGDFANPRYMELLVPNHYEKHVLRMLPSSGLMQLTARLVRLTIQSTYHCRVPANWVPVAS
ncbi:alpha/beta fold hydrolase [Pseudobowmanella zhangzhouensis]|uniref:alpha/beta fold hydrolase n=1 Tax=Pseudobowmanella zhangzhouensis TaxID=1537679 RepID=UPI00360EA3EB